MTFGLEQYADTIEAQIVLSGGVAAAGFGSAYVVRRARTALSDRIAEDNQTASIAVDVVGAVLSLLIAIAAVAAVANIWGQSQTLFGQFENVGGDRGVAQVAVTIVVLIAIQVFTSVSRRLLDDIAEGSDAISDHERELSWRLIQMSFWIVGIVVVLGVWQVDLGGLLIGAGFLGIVVGLAARQTLGSMLAGLVLMFSRPFEVGDWVAIEEDEGIVTDISVMNTQIQAFDGEYVVVPNDVISSQTVKNKTRKGRLRIEVDVGVDYATDVERARELAIEAVSDLDIVMDVPRPETVTKAFDESAITIGVRGWIEHPSSRRRWRARTQMIREVKRAFAESDVKIPFPQRELSGRREQGGLQVAAGRQLEPEDADDGQRGADPDADQPPTDPSGAAADSPPAEPASESPSTDAAADAPPSDGAASGDSDGANADGSDARGGNR